MTIGDRQRDASKPARRSSRSSPHGLPPAITTRVPGRQNSGTCAPTRSITPGRLVARGSRGQRSAGSEPSIRCTSDRQIPHAATRTSTSSGPGSGTGTSSSSRRRVAESKTAARTATRPAVRSPHRSSARARTRASARRRRGSPPCARASPSSASVWLKRCASSSRPGSGSALGGERPPPWRGAIASAGNDGDAPRERVDERPQLVRVGSARLT